MRGKPSLLTKIKIAITGERRIKHDNLNLVVVFRENEVVLEDREGRYLGIIDEKSIKKAGELQL